MEKLVYKGKIDWISGTVISQVFSSVQSLSHVWPFATPWTAACQASLSITNSQSLLKLMFIALVMPSKHLILSRPLFLLPSIFPGIRVFSNESVLVELIWVGGMEGPIDDVWCEFSSQGNWSASEFLNSSSKDTYLPRGAVFCVVMCWQHPWPLPNRWW